MERVCVRGYKPADLPHVIYCGRLAGGWKRSPLCNPYPWKRIGKPAAVARFKAKLETGVLDTIIHALSPHAVLGCWCGLDEACHVDAIIERWKQRRNGESGAAS